MTDEKTRTTTAMHIYTISPEGIIVTPIEPKPDKDCVIQELITALDNESNEMHEILRKEKRKMLILMCLAVGLAITSIILALTQLL